MSKQEKNPPLTKEEKALKVEEALRVSRGATIAAGVLLTTSTYAGLVGEIGTETVAYAGTVGFIAYGLLKLLGIDRQE